MTTSFSTKKLATATVAFVALAALVLGVSALRTSGSASAPSSDLAPTINVGLAPAKTIPTTSGAGHGFGSLPPSHDNDAGGAREHDQTPDADVDAYQRAH